MTPQRMIARLEQAARLLHPVLLGDDPVAATAAHDALNALAAVRLALEESLETLEEPLAHQ